MNLSIYSILLIGLVASGVSATQLHVAQNGNDASPGTKKAPLRTIQRAAQLTQPGDVVTIHAGVYRERVNPPRGGISDAKRIVFQAAPGEHVEIKGSEVIKQWVKVQEEVWKVTLPNSFFGDFNPYSDVIHGDWFDPKSREHHTGAVYLNGDWLTEAASLQDLFKPPGNQPLWFGRVDHENTTLWAQFKGVSNPNEALVEINVRRAVFYPDQPGLNFITVRGLTLSQAATPWAPPTAEQIGLIGTHWSKGWIIEHNIISYSVCCGISLGKYGDQWDNTSANTAQGYVKTIERALQNGWNKETIGHHLIRNNDISHCEQAGIVGSLGAAFSTITGNNIHEIHVRSLFSGAEMAGIKFHAAIDALIRGNHISHTCRGLWLDWMAQGTRVSGNLFQDNAAEDLFVEVDHGPFVVDNNLFLSATSLSDMSEGGAYAHNLFAGRIMNRPEPNRSTPFLVAHSTAISGLVNVRGGDDRFYNNIFIGRGPSEPNFGLRTYTQGEFQLHTGGNVFYNGAQGYNNESNCLSLAQFNPIAKILQDNGRVLLQLKWGPEPKQARTSLVTSALLGKATVPGLPYDNPDRSPLEIGTDYFGSKRNRTHPIPGPFENSSPGERILRIW